MKTKRFSEDHVVMTDVSLTPTEFFLVMEALEKFGNSIWAVNAQNLREKINNAPMRKVPR